jgi:hypothetical protein
MIAADHPGGAGRAGRPARPGQTVVTGTIVELAAGRRTGVIRTPDGSRVIFSASAVLGDFEALAVGHRVNFDLDRAWPGRNASRVLREPPGSTAPSKLDSPPDLRYTGFDQTQNVRTYQFEAIASGYSVRRFTITVDLLLLLKHRIGVQDAPALCLRKLAADLRNSPESPRHELDNEDLLAFALSRAAAVHRKRPAFGHRRGAPPPGPWKRPPEAG